MTKHALLSPSSAHRWRSCPGSVLLNKDKPRTDTEASREGTCAHEFAALALEEGVEVETYVGRESADAPGFIFRKDMVEPTQKYVDFVLYRKSELLDHFETVELFVEVKVPIDHITGEEGATGTSDVILVATHAEGWAHIEAIDFKFGKGVEVSAINNDQGLMYVSGSVIAMKPFLEGPVKYINIIIFQPRKCEEPSIWSMTFDALTVYEQDIAMDALVVSNCLDDAKVFKDEDYINSEAFKYYLCPTEKGCQFCDSKAECPALKSKAVEEAKLEFGNVHSMRSPVEISDVEIMSKVVLNRKLIDTYLDAVEEAAKKRLETGQEVPGLKLVHKASRSKWESEEAAIKAMKKAGLKKPEYTKTSAISITDAKKLVGKEKTKLLEAAIVKPKGAIVAASIDDKREEALGIVLEPVGESDKPSITIN